jgi:alpha-beta hydrolase superfamily lysophospholipase
MALTAAPAPRIKTRDLTEWLAGAGHAVVRIERKDHGRTYRLVVAPAPLGKVDHTLDWRELGFFPTYDEALRHAVPCI